MSQCSTEPVCARLDVHQSSVTAAVLHEGSEKPRVVHLPGEVSAVRKLMRRLSKQGAPRSWYETSGAGYVLQRALDRDGFHCEMIDPSLIPRKPGDHRKTGRLGDSWAIRGWYPHKAVTAVARELSGFIWAALNAVAQEREV